MAAFDSAERKIVVRVIFDGPGFAGKTTNVRQLHGFFTDRRRGDLVVPEERDGRTQVFDWMHLDGGLVHGHGLRCQLVTVPGQAALSKRRWALLRTADVVVFVCESTTTGVEEAAPMFSTLQSYLEERWGGQPPLVVQANKQDLPGAIDPEAVRNKLGLRSEVPIVPATAAGGGGVRETVVLAIREAANRVQRHLLERGLGSLTQTPGTAEELARELQALPGEPPPALTVDVPAPPARRSEPEAAAWASNQRVEPPIPSLDPEVPPGLIWPAATGRDVLRRACAAGDPVHRGDLAGQSGLATGSGGANTFIFEAGMWCLKTSAHRLYRDVDEGRVNLLRVARTKASLGSLLPPNTVVSLHADPDGNHRLWTVCPWMTPLRAVMLHAVSHGDEKALEETLRCYARAAAAAVHLAVRKRMVLDVHPSNFACIGHRMYYLDDDVEEGGNIPSLGHAILQRVVEYPSSLRTWESYADELIVALHGSLTADEIGRSGLRDIFAEAAARTDAAVHVRDRIMDDLRRLAKGSWSARSGQSHS